MSARKQRLTVTVDASLLDAGQRAVASGEAASVSAWVSTAIEEKLHRDQKLAQLAVAIADFEREFGEITPEEIAQQRRSDLKAATVVRGKGQRAPRRAKSA